jgi:hypothetical protein
MSWSILASLLGAWCCRRLSTLHSKTAGTDKCAPVAKYGRMCNAWLKRAPKHENWDCEGSSERIWAFYRAFRWEGDVEYGGVHYQYWLRPLDTIRTLSVCDCPLNASVRRCAHRNECDMSRSVRRAWMRSSSSYLLALCRGAKYKRGVLHFWIIFSKCSRELWLVRHAFVTCGIHEGELIALTWIRYRGLRHSKPPALFWYSLLWAVRKHFQPFPKSNKPYFLGSSSTAPEGTARLVESRDFEVRRFL